jgi:hypothetical protein
MKSVKSVPFGTPAIALAILTLCVASAALLCTQFAPVVRASGGRDFAGFYEVSDATVLGDQVRLTFSARIFNYSDAYITSATVTLAGPGAPDGNYATFNGISLSDKQSVRLSREITIPQHEYERWGKGQTPLLTVDYVDLSGAMQRRGVELSLGPVGKE